MIYRHYIRFRGQRTLQISRTSSPYSIGLSVAKSGSKVSCFPDTMTSVSAPIYDEWSQHLFCLTIPIRRVLVLPLRWHPCKNKFPRRPLWHFWRSDSSPTQRQSRSTWNQAPSWSLNPKTWLEWEFVHMEHRIIKMLWDFNWRPCTTQPHPLIRTKWWRIRPPGWKLSLCFLKLQNVICECRTLFQALSKVSKEPCPSASSGRIRRICRIYFCLIVDGDCITDAKNKLTWSGSSQKRVS